MGLFERRQTPIVSTLYTLGSEQTKLIVGLGNTGHEYFQTRHNAGFIAVDRFVINEDGAWKLKKDFKAHVAELRLGNVRVIVLKPTTLMNLSGDAVQAAKRFYKLDNKDIVVVHDELDIKFGTIRTRRGGSSAGHNGIKSVTASIGDDYYRVRVGIKNKIAELADSADFVLGKFDKKEVTHLPAMEKEVASLLVEFVYGSDLPADTRQFII